jgi:hypothetical protein
LTYRQDGQDRPERNARRAATAHAPGSTQRPPQRSQHSHLPPASPPGRRTPRRCASTPVVIVIGVIAIVVIDVGGVGEAAGGGASTRLDGGVFGQESFRKTSPGDHEPRTKQAAMHTLARAYTRSRTHACTHHTRTHARAYIRTSALCWGDIRAKVSAESQPPGSPMCCQMQTTLQGMHNANRVAHTRTALRLSGVSRPCNCLQWQGWQRMAAASLQSTPHYAMAVEASHSYR